MHLYIYHQMCADHLLPRTLQRLLSLWGWHKDIFPENAKFQGSRGKESLQKPEEKGSDKCRQWASWDPCDLVITDSYMTASTWNTKKIVNLVTTLIKAQDMGVSRLQSTLMKVQLPCYKCVHAIFTMWDSSFLWTPHRIKDIIFIIRANKCH